MNSKDFFGMVNKICEEYKTEHGIKDVKPQPKFQAGQQVLWSGYSGLNEDKNYKCEDVPRIAIYEKWSKNDKCHWIIGNGQGGHWWVAKSELRGVGDLVYWNGKSEDSINIHPKGLYKIEVITKEEVLLDGAPAGYSGCNIAVKPEGLSFTLPEPKMVYGERGNGLTGWIVKPEHPAPKFAKGDKTNQGMIMFINHYGYDTLYTALKDGEYHNYFESELTKLPEPKFSVGDKTNKGIIEGLTHYHPIYGQRYKTDDKFEWWEYEITKLPESGITVTLWRVDKDGKVKTETNTYPPEMNNWHRDGRAENAFSSGYCAILIDDGKKKMRKYCLEIEALQPNRAYAISRWTGWHNPGEAKLTEADITKNIEAVINHPCWTVSSNGVKMRAYRMKDGDVEVVFNDLSVLYSPHLINHHAIILTALGFNESNIMPQILSGKE